MDDPAQGVRYFVLDREQRAPRPASEAEWDAELEAGTYVLAQTWVADGVILDDDGQHTVGPEAETVVSVTTEHLGIGDDYFFYTQLWTDDPACQEQEPLVGYRTWDEAMAGHHLVVALVRAGRLRLLGAVCADCKAHVRSSDPSLGVLGSPL